ncbi:GNAT family N-acetyltransferase [soil metagenome]
MSLQVQHKKPDNKGSFYIEKDGKRVAEMTYVMAGEANMIIDHTEVSDALRGQGAGAEMVAAAVVYARENGIKIRPLCPFAKAVFDKTPEYIDVL